MIGEIPFSIVLEDGVVIGPAFDRLIDDALIGERAIRAVTRRIDNLVRVACGIGQVICVPDTIDPGGLKEAAVMILCLDRVSVLIKDHHILRRFCEGDHIVSHFGDLRHQRDIVWLVGFILICQRIIVDQIRVQVRIIIVFACRPALQLAAPDAAEIHVVFAVIIFEDSRVHREGPFYGFRLGGEGTGRAV